MGGWPPQAPLSAPPPPPPPSLPHRSFGHPLIANTVPVRSSLTHRPRTVVVNVQVRAAALGEHVERGTRRDGDVVDPARGDAEPASKEASSRGGQDGGTLGQLPATPWWRREVCEGGGKGRPSPGPRRSSSAGEQRAEQPPRQSARCSSLLQAATRMRAAPAHSLCHQVGVRLCHADGVVAVVCVGPAGIGARRGHAHGDACRPGMTRRVTDRDVLEGGTGAGGGPLHNGQRQRWQCPSLLLPTLRLLTSRRGARACV